MESNGAHGCQDRAEHVDSDPMTFIVNKQLEKSERELHGLVRRSAQVDSELLPDTDDHLNRDSEERMAGTASSVEITSDALLKDQEVFATGRDLQSSTIQNGRLASLPDEILAMILGYAAMSSTIDYGMNPFDDIFDNPDIRKTRMKLSYVCRRFMAILSSSRYIISTSMNPDMVSMKVDRVTAPSVQIHFGKEGRFLDITANKLEDFLQKVITCSTNWRSLRIFPCFSSTDAPAILAHETHNLHVPNLSLLAIYPFRKIVNRRPETNDPTQIHFYSTWKTPNLQTLVASYMIPTPFAASSSLKTLGIYYGLTDDSTEALSALSRFLVSCPKLETLALDMWFQPLIPTAFIPSIWSAKSIALQSLKFLHLRFLRWFERPLSFFLDAFFFPNVSALTMIIGSSFFRTPADAMFSVVTKFARSLPRLERIDLDGLERVELASFPTIKHICCNSTSWIIASTTQGSEDGTRTILPDLRTLEFRNCNTSCREVLLALQQLKDQGITPLITMENCTWYEEDEEGIDHRQQVDLIRVDPNEVIEILLTNARRAAA